MIEKETNFYKEFCLKPVDCECERCGKSNLQTLSTLCTNCMIEDICSHSRQHKDVFDQGKKQRKLKMLKGAAYTFTVVMAGSFIARFYSGFEGHMIFLVSFLIGQVFNPLVNWLTEKF